MTKSITIAVVECMEWVDGGVGGTRQKVAVSWRETGKGRMERVGIDKLDSSFKVLCYKKKEQKNGATAEEQTRVKGGFLFFSFS